MGTAWIVLLVLYADPCCYRAFISTSGFVIPASSSDSKGCLRKRISAKGNTS